jgi:hypothetical protein
VNVRKGRTETPKKKRRRKTRKKTSPTTTSLSYRLRHAFASHAVFIHYSLPLLLLLDCSEEVADSPFQLLSVLSPGPFFPVPFCCQCEFPLRNAAEKREENVLSVSHTGCQYV